MKSFIMILGLSVLVTSCNQYEKKRQRPIEVSLQAKNESHVSGKAIFTERPLTVLLQLSMSGFEPNTKHGIHIHENGDCSADDASSAGGHFSPQGNPHGEPRDPQSHVGDLGNVVSNSVGKIETSIEIDKANLYQENELSIYNKALIVHKDADDLSSQPSGNSGDRVACAVIALK